MEDKRQRIMQAAERLFRVRQFHEITLEEVAQHALVAKGTLYLYFADKEDLFFQTALAGFDDMCRMLRRNPVTAGPVREELREACETISTFFQNRRPLFRMMLAEGQRALDKGGGLRQRWNKQRKKMVQALAEVIRRGVQRGEVRSEVKPEVLAEYFLGLLRTRSNELQSLPERERNQGALVDLFVHGLAGAAERRARTRSRNAKGSCTG